MGVSVSEQLTLVHHAIPVFRARARFSQTWIVRLAAVRDLVSCRLALRAYPGANVVDKQHRPTFSKRRRHNNKKAHVINKQS